MRGQACMQMTMTTLKRCGALPWQLCDFNYATAI